MNEVSSQVSHIKQEREDSSDNPIQPQVKKREVLMDLGLLRKKVFFLDDTNTLALQFEKQVSCEPAFRELLTHAFPVFQEYNTKFGTWVDVDKEENLSDGAVIKVIYFPKTIETDDANPGSIKRKRNNCESEQELKKRRIQNKDVQINSFSSDVYSQCNKTENFTQKNISNLDIPACLQYGSPKNKTIDKMLKESIPSDSQTTIQCNTVNEKYCGIGNVSLRKLSDLCSPASRQTSVHQNNGTSEAVSGEFLSNDVFYNTVNEMPEITETTDQQIHDVVTPPMQALPGWNSERLFLIPERNNCNSQVETMNVNFPKNGPSHFQHEPTQFGIVSDQRINQVTAANIQPCSIMESEPLRSHNHYVPESALFGVVSTERINQVHPANVQPCSFMERELSQLHVPEFAPFTFASAEEINQTSTANAQSCSMKKKPRQSGHVPESSPRVTEHEIQWNKNIPTQLRQQRANWATQNADVIWWNTLFSGVARFVLKGNNIKYIKNYNQMVENGELLWGCRSFDGPNIIAPVKLTVTKNCLSEILKSKVVKSAKYHYKDAKITLQFLCDLKTQYLSNSVKDIVVKNSMKFSEWPNSTRDISPIEHAWRLAGEKVKSIPCSSRKEMITIITQVWENDVDIQLMCAQFIRLLPQILKSVIQEGGKYPKVTPRYLVTE